MYVWWRDVISESVQKHMHSPVVKIGLRYGMALFIASEVMFFSAFFWAYFDGALFYDEAIQAARVQAISVWIIAIFLFSGLVTLANGLLNALGHFRVPAAAQARTIPIEAPARSGPAWPGRACRPAAQAPRAPSPSRAAPVGHADPPGHPLREQLLLGGVGDGEHPRVLHAALDEPLAADEQLILQDEFEEFGVRQLMAGGFLESHVEGLGQARQAELAKRRFERVFHT